MFCITSSKESRYGSQANYLTVLQNMMQSYIQEEEGKRYEDEMQEYLEEQGGDQLAIRKENTEVESESGKL